MWGRQTRATVTRLQPRMNIGHGSIFIAGLFWLLIYSLSFDIVTPPQLATQTNKKHPIAKGQGAKGEEVAIIYFLQLPNNY